MSGLLVSVTADRYVQKGMGRPHFTEDERVEALKALECVDDAFVCQEEGPWDLIGKLKPDVYCKGIDYAHADDHEGFQRDLIAVWNIGGRVHITKAQKYSSSRLLNAQRLAPDVLAYLEGIRHRGFAEKIDTAMARADEMKIAFVGESIIDEYRYVRGLGKPSKEFILATVEDRCEIFAGGIDAAAKHCEWKRAGVVIVPEGKLIRKTRFVDVDFSRKLFEVYSSVKWDFDDGSRLLFRNELLHAISDSDLVVVMDFGHGLLGDYERAMLHEAKFLAVNAQTNAGNTPFNSIMRYRRADLVCVDEPEARLALGEREWGPQEMVHRLPGEYNVVTLGRYGCVGGLKGGQGFCTIPAFTQQGIDTIGAGDAFLAATAPLVAAGLELEAAAFVGNVAGAIKTTIVGHQRHVTRAEIMQNVKALLA